MNGFFPVLDEVVERAAVIGPMAVLVYCVLAYHCRDKRVCWPSIERIASLAGCSASTARRAIVTLKNADLIKVQPTQDKDGTSTANRYHLPPVGYPVTGDTLGCHGCKGEGVTGAQGEGVTSDTPRTIQEKNNTNRTKRALGSFDVFWGIIPSHKKKAKLDAEKAYHAALRRLNGKHADPVAFLLDRARAYYASPLGQTRYCNGPAPFLNQGHYEDDPAAWERDGNGKAQVETKPPAPIRLFPTRTK